MTRILTANIGSFPRIGEDKDKQRHRRGYAHFEKKDISSHAFHDVEQSVIQEIIKEQMLCGLDEVTDGLVTWADPISHFCRNVSGVEITGLARYFNTNFYHRVPVIVSKPRLKQTVLAKEFVFAQSVSNKPVRAVVTGPLTLAAHTASEMKSFKKLSARFDFFTQVVKQEVARLSVAGAATVQIDEPYLPRMPAAFPWLRKSLAQISASAPSAKLILALYYSPLAPHWAALQSLPVQGLNLDFTADGDKLFRTLLGNPGSKEIGFGILDAASTQMESAEEVAERVRHWMKKNPGRTCVLTPSAGLESIPRSVAFEKISLLSQIREALQPVLLHESAHV